MQRNTMMATGAQTWQVRHFEVRREGPSPIGRGWEIWTATDTRELPGRHADRERVYAIRELEPTGEARQWEIRNRDNGNRYRITMRETDAGGWASCTCPAGVRPPRASTTTEIGICVHVDLLNAWLRAQFDDAMWARTAAARKWIAAAVASP